ncbi:hypothetical protein [Chitinibacter tainanensis]|uniref:hypothetical protein n=1 Tax=Chitinibacter tainanensis TaxID=230667 RepID=UPI00041B3AEA|nr:hypothetical protein [Chitinibacter tainanensis]
MESLSAQHDIAELISAVELGYWQSNAAQHRDCRRLLELCLARRHPMLGYAYLLYGRTFLIVGDLPCAREKLKRGLAHCRRHQQFEHYPLGLLWLGVVELQQQRYSRALKAWGDAIQLALEQSNLDVVIECCLNLGVLYRTAGLQTESGEVLMASFSVAESIDSKKLLAKSGIYVAESLMIEQRYAEALAVLLRAEHDVILHGDVTWIAQLCGNKGYCLWRTGNLAGAEACFDTSLTMARAFKLGWVYIFVALYFARFLLEQERIAEANEIIDSAFAYFDLYPERQFLVQWYELKYKVLKSLGRYPDALVVLKTQQGLKLAALSEDYEAASSPHLVGDLRRRYQALRRIFRKIEGLVELPNVRAGIRQLTDFRARCEAGRGVDRLIELVVRPQNKKTVIQRTMLTIREYCSGKDAWVKIADGRFLIYPGHSDKSLFEFAHCLVKAIEALAGGRLSEQPIQARSRILLVDDDVIAQLNMVIDRGWHDAG